MIDAWINRSIDRYACRRKFRSQASDLWTDAAAVVRRVREEEESEEKKSEKRVTRKKIKAREKVERLRNALCFRCFVAPGGRKVGSLKGRVLLGG